MSITKILRAKVCALRKHPINPNRITPLPRKMILGSISHGSAEIVGQVARKWNITTCEAIDRIIRAAVISGEVVIA